MSLSRLSTGGGKGVSKRVYKTRIGALRDNLENSLSVLMIKQLENLDLLDLLEATRAKVMNQLCCQCLGKTQIFIILKLEAHLQAQEILFLL